MKQEKFIEVIDNIHFKLKDKLEHYVLHSNQIKWDFTPNLSGVPNHVIPGISHTFYSSNSPHNINTHTSFYILQVLYQMCFVKNIEILNIFEGRVFLQLPSPNPQPFLSAIHTDLQDQNHWVCLYYVNDSEGDTIFFDDNNKEIKRISPKKGRIAFFDGSIKHTGSSSSLLRSVININFLGRKLG